jgi:tetratricopeptide (TPR) repeat protein
VFSITWFLRHGGCFPSVAEESGFGSLAVTSCVQGSYIMGRLTITCLICGFIAVEFPIRLCAQGSQSATAALPGTFPQPATLERTLAVQRAMVVARHLLEQRQPVEAVKVLEAVLQVAEGQTGYLELLRQAYQAELTQWEQLGRTDSRVDQLKRYIDLLQNSPTPQRIIPQLDGIPPPANSTRPNTSTIQLNRGNSGKSEAQLLQDLPHSPVAGGVAGQNLNAQNRQEACLNEAVTFFQQKKYAEAAQRFAQVDHLSPQHKSAWAYCLIHVSVERLHQKVISPAQIQSVIADLQTARDLLPGDAELRRYAEQALRMAQKKAQQFHPSSSQQSGTDPSSETPNGMAPNGVSRTAETNSFRISGNLSSDRLEDIGRIAEKYRQELFERWSGPVAGTWQPKCEIIVYAKAEEFARATGLSPDHRSVAQVKLTEGQVVERRIHIWTGDDREMQHRLKRELMHVILADLFPQWTPPRWAVEGIAVLAAGSEELERYQHTLIVKISSHHWLPLAQLLELRDCPADRVTLFCCQSASLVNYLVQTGGGEKNFIIFLRDAQRYGMSAALKRQYGYVTPHALEAAWKKWVLQEPSEK